MKTLFSASSKWNATSLTFDHGTSQRSGDWKVGDKRPFASHSMSKPLSASTEFGQMTVIDKRKSQIVGVFLLGNHRLHDLCESPLPENRESKEGNKDTESVQPQPTSM